MSRLRRWFANVFLAVVPSTQPPSPSLGNVPTAGPVFDLVTCPTCDQPFYRVRGVHPETTCIDCEMRRMDTWITNYEARQAVNGSFIRRLS